MSLLNRSRSHTSRVLTSLFCGLIVASCGGAEREQPTEPEDTDPRLTTVEVNPDSARIDSLGGTVDFDAVARDQRENTMSGVDFSWTVSDTSVASVDQSGLARAKGTGTTDVTAKARGVSDSAELVVQIEEDAPGLPAPVTEVLPARFYGASVWDPVGERMLVYGGSALEPSDELWSYDPSAGTWTRLSTGPTPLLTHEAAWDGVNDRMLVFGGNSGGQGFSLRDELWAYDPESSDWTELDPGGGGPSARDLHTMVWAPSREAAFVFAGKEGDKTANLNDLWRYRPAENTWEQLNPSGAAPDPRRGHSAVWDPEGERMLVFGGWNNKDPRDKDLWSYRPEENSWRELTTGGEPPRRFRHGAAWNPGQQEMLIFGGCCGPPTGFKHDLWSYRDGSWREQRPGRPRPAGRNRITAMTVWDPVHEVMLVYGGQGECFAHNDLWAYVPREDRWIRLSQGELSDPLARAEHASAWLGERSYMFGGCDGARRNAELLAYDPASQTVDRLSPSGSNPSARVQHAMVAVPEEGKIYLFGGQGGTDIMLNDLWSFDPEMNEWTELDPSGGPPRIRKDFAIAWAPSRGRIYLFGGKAPDGFLSDLWAYDVADDQWIELPDSESAPHRRAEGRGVWDPVREEFLVYGGWFLDDRGRKTVYNEVWAYDPASQSWERAAAWNDGGGPPHRLNGTFVWDPREERALLFGGRRFQAPRGEILTNDLWAFDPETRSWTEIQPTGALPPVRTNHGAVWNPATDQLLILSGFGGESGSYLPDIWRFDPDSDSWMQEKGP